MNSPSDVTLSIYNVLGEQVLSLQTDILSAGTYKYHWDSKDNKEKDVNPGVYFYKFEAGDTTFTKKIALLK